MAPRIRIAHAERYPTLVKVNITPKTPLFKIPKVPKPKFHNSQSPLLAQNQNVVPKICYPVIQKPKYTKPEPSPLAKLFHHEERQEKKIAHRLKIIETEEARSQAIAQDRKLLQEKEERRLKKIQEDREKASAERQLLRSTLQKAEEEVSWFKEIEFMNLTDLLGTETEETKETNSPTYHKPGQELGMEISMDTASPANDISLVEKDATMSQTQNNLEEIGNREEHLLDEIQKLETQLKILEDCDLQVILSDLNSQKPPKLLSPIHSPLSINDTSPELSTNKMQEEVVIPWGLTPIDFTLSCNENVTRTVADTAKHVRDEVQNSPSSPIMSQLTTQSLDIAPVFMLHAKRSNHRNPKKRCFKCRQRNHPTNQCTNK